MEYLLFLQRLREAAPQWFNEAILFVSEFTGGAGCIVLMALIYWCINKRAGIFLMMNFSLSYVCNTVVKNIFCVERPFNRDTRLTPYVPASGYSFPSGHTMLATGFYGSLAVWQRKRTWLAALCVFLAFFTAFTRNWLGVHTPEDVLFGIFCSACVIAVNGFCLKWAEAQPGRDKYFLIASVVVFTGFCLLYPTALKPAGIYGGVMLGWFLERRFIGFEISERIADRVITAAAGAVVLGLLYKVLLPLLFASFEQNVSAMLTYFATFLVITAGWPLVLKTLAKKKLAISAKNRSAR